MELRMDAATLGERDGLAVVRGYINGQTAVSTTAAAFGLLLENADRGHTRWVGGVAPFATLDPTQVPLGSLGVAADLALTTAVITTQEPGHGCVTTTLSLDHLVAALPPGTDRLITDGRLIRWDGPDGYADAEVSTPDGTVVARATAWCRALPVTRQMQQTVAAPVAPAPTPVPATDGAVRGDLADVVTDLLRIEEVTVAGGVACVRTGDGSLRNRRGNMHGGLPPLLAEIATRALLGGGDWASTPARMLTQHADYLRPVGNAGRGIVCRAEPVRQGRGMAVVRAVLTDEYTADRPGIVVTTTVSLR